jgi:hypothetical protein
MPSTRLQEKNKALSILHFPLHVEAMAFAQHTIESFKTNSQVAKHKTKKNLNLFYLKKNTTKKVETVLTF